MKVEKKSYENHPEGWYLFLLGEPELTEATYNSITKPRLKWPCTSMSVKSEDGGEMTVNLFTGVELTDHPLDTHRALVEDGFNIASEHYDDTDQVAGKMFAGKVEHKEKTGRANIVKFDTQDRIKPAGKAGLPKIVDREKEEYEESLRLKAAAKPKDAVSVDPFAEE